MSAIFSSPVQITVTPSNQSSTPSPSKITLLPISPSTGEESTVFTASGYVYDQNDNLMSGVTVYLFSYLCVTSRGQSQEQWNVITDSSTGQAVSGTTDNNGFFTISFTGEDVMNANGLGPSEANLVFAIEASNQSNQEPSIPSCSNSSG